jgi:23S rRNA pseudouridine1911/1915/1917 synthase
LENSIVYESEDYLIFNKPAGMQSVESKLGVSYVEQYLQGLRPYPDLHVHQRLDLPVSGLMSLSKHSQATQALSQALILPSASKQYLAICHKADIPQAGNIQDYLVRDGKKMKAHITHADHQNAKLAELSYKVILQMDNYLVLDVKLHTGRFHQIRCQLAHLGIPIKGDVKYGARRRNPDRSLYLHAYRLAFEWRGQLQAYIQAPLPDPLWDLAWAAMLKKQQL